MDFSPGHGPTNTTFSQGKEMGPRPKHMDLRPGRGPLADMDPMPSSSLSLTRPFTFSFTTLFRNIGQARTRANVQLQDMDFGPGQGQVQERYISPGQGHGSKARTHGPQASTWSTGPMHSSSLSLIRAFPCSFFVLVPHSPILIIMFY